MISVDNKKVFKKIIAIICVYCILYVSSAFSQTLNVDSVSTLLSGMHEDTSKVNLLNTLFLKLEYENEQQAKKYIDQSYEISKKIGYTKGMASSITLQGYFAEDKGNYPDALSDYSSALQIFKNAGDRVGVANSYNYIGISYFNLGNYPEALKNYFLALKLKEEINDRNGCADIYNNIGLVYSSQDNYKEALKYYSKSVGIYEALKNKAGLSLSYNNLGIIYRADGNYNKALNNYLASLKIDESLGNKRGMSSSYNNIGNVYSDLKNYKEAFSNLLISLKLREEIGDQAGKAGCFINLGDLFMKQGMFAKAEKYFIEAKELMAENPNKEYYREIYKALVTLDSAKGDFKSAYANRKQYILYRDSLDNEETRKATVQNQMTYDFEKKEAVAAAEHKKELESQSQVAGEKNRKQMIVLISVVGVFLLVIIFSAFIFRSLRFTRKQKQMIEDQKKIVEDQKLLVEKQKLLVEEHQKEIIDSITYARRIQLSQLPTEKYIQSSLVRLNKKIS